MSHWSERWGKWWRPPPMADADWQAAVSACSLAKRLDAASRRHLRGLVERFLARKRFHPAADAELDAAGRHLIALQACVPVLGLGLGFRALRGWRSVIVYPGEFGVRHDHHDEYTGVVTEVEDAMIGEAWERGPLVLSWADVQADLEHPWQGCNVVVHEIAHKLDMLDGPPDGVPVLPRTISRRAWIDAFQRAYDDLVDTLERGRESRIDPYAAENPAEYFAVVSEMHFSTPSALARAEPTVAALLAAYYGPSPAP